MNKLLRTIVLALTPLLLIYSFLFTLISPASATSIRPFAPFSTEGNPDEDYYFSSIFPLLGYIDRATFEIYENANRKRNYENLEVCPGADADRRDKYCNNQGDGCDGGDVDLCHRPGGEYARTANSSNGSCKLDRPKTKPSRGNPNPDPNELIDGHCEYLQRPVITHKFKGTDFSVNKTLTYSKIQSEELAYDNIGGTNSITWGSQRLALDQGQQATNQLMVIVRAKQSQNTKNSTGEWPLGWVDWGYITPNGKTLIAIYGELPAGLVSATEKIIDANDALYLDFDGTAPIIDTSSQREYISTTVAAAALLKPQPDWLIDLFQSPLYSPSWRQGYVRPSICVWDLCCPGGRCKVEPLGNKRGLYYDISISQTFGAALDNLFTQYPLEQGRKIFKELADQNPLIRYLASASPDATPSKIREVLDVQLKGTCFDYFGISSWFGWGTHIDYLDEGDPAGPNGTCPDYHIMPAEIVKELAAARSDSLIDALVKLLWGKSIDQVDEVVYHLITVPDAMGQSIQEIQQPVYDSRDSLAELESIKEFNTNMSNIVDDGGDNLFSGKSSNPADSKRRLALYACSDEMYSSQKTTSIEDYAMGARVGCFDTSTIPEGKCDGQLFAKLIEGGSYTETSQKGQAYFDSNIKARLTPELMKTYAAAEKETGVPCEILAGIHFVEADNSLDGSLVSGRKIGTPEPDAGGKVFHSLLETAIYAGGHLKGKVGGDIKDSKTAITALSRYNGGGNSNCQAGYPYPIPYGGCPRLFEGEDDPYPTDFIDNKHDTMYLLYCADYTACAPQVFERPGSFTVALNVYNSITKSGYENSDLPPVQPPSTNPPNTPTTTIPTPTGFFPQSCGPESLSTALGCIPYTREAFVSSLLTTIVGIAGAIALVTMLIATFLIMTAGGNAEQLKKAKELFTSAVIGLLFLIFSVSILRLVAGSIIKLPGF